PVNTGWFAGFGKLEAAPRGPVSYPADASRFAGASLAPDGIYRFDAVLTLLSQEGVDSAAVHERVRALQESFLQKLSTPALPHDQLLLQGARGNFLTWRTPHAGVLQHKLAALGIICDHRDDRLRLGFGLYHDPEDMAEMASRVSQL
ncbi:MAG: aminotransferase, partial [Deltaproteobacteria bacterium]